MQNDELRDEIQAEMESLLQREAAGTRTLHSDTLRTPIAEVQLRPLVMVAPDTSVEAAVAQMVSHRAGCLLVSETERLQGIFTERDVLTRVVGRAREPAATTVREVMSPDPEALTPLHTIGHALSLMQMGGYRHVPIADPEGRPLGVLAVRDILDYLADFFPREILTLSPHSEPTLPLHGG